MKRRKDNDVKKVTTEGTWGKGQVTAIAEKKGLYYIVAVSDNLITRRSHEFISNGLKEVPEDIGIGSTVSICVWDNDEYVMDLDGCLSRGWV